jgi:hypothetical protein
MSKGKMVRRFRKGLVLALLALNLSGARAVTVSGLCETNRVVFHPGLSFKAIAKTVTHQGWKQRAPDSLGAHTKQYSARDLDSLRGDNRLAPIAVVSQTTVVLDPEGAGRRCRTTAWKLATDEHPVQSPHLKSKN